MGAEGNGAVLFGLYAHLLLHSVPEEEKEAANGKEAVCSAVRNRSPMLENARFFKEGEELLGLTGEEEYSKIDTGGKDEGRAEPRKEKG